VVTAVNPCFCRSPEHAVLTTGEQGHAHEDQIARLELRRGVALAVAVFSSLAVALVFAAWMASR
jgi:hypothetical protein